MHKSSILRMERFVNTYVRNVEKAKILDVGSYDVNGSYKNLFESLDVSYVGLDIAAGPNVDIVMDDVYHWNTIEDDEFDFIISGQAFEHIEYPWLTIKEMYKKLKPGGMICVIAPNSLREHRYPFDCYRYWGDGFSALAKWAGFNVVEVSVAGIPEKGVSSEWDDPSNDVCLIAGKFDEIPSDLKGKKIFPYERRFEVGKNFEIHYEFLNIWYNLKNKEEIISQYIKSKNKKKVYIYGYEHVGKELEKILKSIEVEYQVIVTKNILISWNVDEYSGSSYPGTVSEHEYVIDDSTDALMIITIFDYSCDYINYLDKIYSNIQKIYLYDLFGYQKCMQFKQLNPKIYLYGAGKFGKYIYDRFSEWNIEVEAFVVSDGYQTQNEYCGKKIYQISEIDKTSTIVVSVLQHDDIINNLKDKEYSNVIDGESIFPLWKYTNPVKNLNTSRSENEF